MTESVWHILVNQKRSNTIMVEDPVETDSAFSKLDHDNLITKLITSHNCLVIDKLIPFITACFEIRRTSFSIISQ